MRLLLPKNRCIPKVEWTFGQTSLSVIQSVFQYIYTISIIDQYSPKHVQMMDFVSATGRLNTTSPTGPASPAPTILTHLPERRLSKSHGDLGRPYPVQPPAASAVANASVAATTPIAEGPVLLLVDDNRVNLQLLVAFAKMNKFRYVPALEGNLALDAFEEAHRNSLEPSASGEATVEIPTVVLMDTDFPVMDGYESTRRIRAYEGKHQMKPAKIIAVTALQSEAAQTEAFGSGFNMFLSKPIKLKSLSERIQEG
jgi:CheY-like chemotaxis protein